MLILCLCFVICFAVTISICLGAFEAALRFPSQMHVTCAPHCPHPLRPLSECCGDSLKSDLQIGAFFANTPTCVIGGITTFLFGSIAISGIKVGNQDGLRRFYSLSFRRLCRSSKNRLLWSCWRLSHDIFTGIQRLSCSQT